MASSPKTRIDLEMAVHAALDEGEPKLELLALIEEYIESWDGEEGEDD